MSLRLSAKYGVNPAIPICFWCLEKKNMIILFGSALGGREASSNTAFDKEPCDKCRGYMKKGVILISAKEPKSEEESKNPFRTGGFWVVSEDMVRRAFKPQAMVDHALKARVCFISNKAAEAWGLPGWEKLFGVIPKVEPPQEPPAGGTITEGGDHAAS